MRKDLIMSKPIYSSFLSCGRDIQLLLKTLFVTSNPYSNVLKRLLVINNKDCLDMTNKDYEQIVSNMSLSDLIEKGYVRRGPKVIRGTHEEIKTYLLINFNHFSSNSESSDFRDYTININIVCYNDAWELNDYLSRPLAICGYIDGILNSLSNNDKKYDKSNKSQIKLGGIGQYDFIQCFLTVLNEDLSMYTLIYRGMQFSQSIQKLGNINAK